MEHFASDSLDVVSRRKLLCERIREEWMHLIVAGEPEPTYQHHLILGEIIEPLLESMTARLQDKRLQNKNDDLVAPLLSASRWIDAAHVELSSLFNEFELLRRAIRRVMRTTEQINGEDYDIIEEAIGRELEAAAQTIMAAQVRERQQLLSLVELDLHKIKEEREIRERFVSTLTHDLRGPLSVAHMCAEMLRMQNVGGDYSEMIIENIARANAMITDLLDANQIRAGGCMPIRRKNVEIVALVREALQQLAVVHGDRFVLSGDAAVHGWWDPLAILRIVENLCSNAIKYGAADTPVTVTVKGEDNEVVLSVHNEGEPMSEAEQAQVFEPFLRTHTARRSGQKGWGLGLTLVRGLAQAHRGQVLVSSSRERGTTFSVRMACDAPSTPRA